ncbi:hypothetical protein E6H29_02060 [Candidatus Bathyarchaeota archaeon]|nr:MAG: hypothetical protein E6H29_02060 [Candidatus Bathyarchaeota archaeon]
MKKLTWLIIPLLVLTVVTLPAGLPRKAVAATQNGPTYWAPFGPREENLLMTVYAVCSTTMNEFQNG